LSKDFTNVEDGKEEVVVVLNCNSLFFHSKRTIAKKIMWVNLIQEISNIAKKII